MVNGAGGGDTAAGTRRARRGGAFGRGRPDHGCPGRRAAPLSFAAATSLVALLRGMRGEPRERRRNPPGASALLGRPRGRGARPALDDRFQGVQRSSAGSAAGAGLAVRCGRCAGWRRQRENPLQEADAHAAGCHRHHACRNRGSRSGREMCRTPGAADRTVAL